MKKIIASLALGGVLMAGFLFAQDNQSTELVFGELEPSILSVSNSDLV
ncbi:hypothetical protein [Ornithinibacillus gellani]|nr:hypothetical protein [Ornithinibacillus gellani]